MRAIDLLSLLRPHQWVKNAFVAGPLLFAQRFFHPDDLSNVALAVASFCCASSAAYTLNDVLDRDRDRTHPLKRERPVAAGRVSVPAASALGFVVLVASIALSFTLGAGFQIVLGAYLLLQILYSAALKNIIVLDSVTISIGFTLRAAAGVIVVNAEMSPWLLICTFLLAEFLALGKRRHEAVLLGEDARTHRQVLDRYSVALLDQLIGITAVATVVVYSLYTISPDVAEKLDTQYLYFTVPFVVFGVFRYLFLVYGREKGGSPTDVLLGDLPLQLGITGWVLTVFSLLYR
jgi:4-hydroxybenzoate polyprenyltransferase